MKVLVVACLLLVSCSGDGISSDQQAREIAWNALSASEKSTVITQWQQAHVSSEIYQNVHVYAVMFNTTEDPLLGPIVVYVDMFSKRVIGYAPRF